MTPIAHIRSAVAVIEALLRAIESENDPDGEELARAIMAAEGLLRLLQRFLETTEGAA